MATPTVWICHDRRSWPCTRKAAAWTRALHIPDRLVACAEGSSANAPGSGGVQDGVTKSLKLFFSLNKPGNGAMIRSVVLALILLVTTSAASIGQTRPEQAHDADPGPVGMLLKWKADLALTESQVARLTEIEASVDRQNEQPLAQLTEIRRRLRALPPPHRLDPERKAQFDSLTASMRPLAKQLEKNMHEGMTQAIGVLTETQRRNVWGLMQQQQQRDRNRDRNSNTPRLSSPGR